MGAELYRSGSMLPVAQIYGKFIANNFVEISLDTYIAYGRKVKFGAPRSSLSMVSGHRKRLATVA